MKKCLILLVILGFLPTLSKAQQKEADVYRYRNFETQQRINTDALRFFTKADNALKTGDLVAAEMALDQAIAEDPYFAEAYLKRALLYYRLKRIGSAQQDFQMAQRLNPYAADLYGYRGSLGKLEVLAFEPENLLAEPDWQEVIDMYAKREERFVEKENEKIYFHNVLETLRTKDWLIALDMLEQWMKLDPEPEAYDLKGLILQQQEKPEAEQWFRKAIEVDSSYAIAYYNLGTVYVNRSAPKKAIDFFDKAIQRDKDLELAYFRRAMLRKVSGAADAALEDYEQYSRTASRESLVFWTNRSINRKLLGDAEGALEDVEKAIDGNPNEPDLYKLRGNIYVLLGEYWRALDDYDYCLRLDAGNAEVYYNRGLAHLMMYNKSDGCADLQQSAALGYLRAEQKIKFFCANN